jgi:hypothetical protein
MFLFLDTGVSSEKYADSSDLQEENDTSVAFSTGYMIRVNNVN